MTLLTLDAALTLILAMMGGAFAHSARHAGLLAGSVGLGAMGLVLAYLSANISSMAELVTANSVFWMIFSVFSLFYTAALAANLIVFHGWHRPRAGMRPQGWLGQFLGTTLATFAALLVRGMQVFFSADEAAYFIGMLFSSPLSLGLFLLAAACTAAIMLYLCRRAELHSRIWRKLEEHLSDQD